MRPIKVFDKYITYLIVYTPIPEVGANSRLAKVHILKSGPAMAGLVPPPLSLQTLLPSIENTWINYLANGYGSVITCTMVDGNLSLLYSLFDSQYYIQMSLYSPVI